MDNPDKDTPAKKAQCSFPKKELGASEKCVNEQGDLKVIVVDQCDKRPIKDAESKVNSIQKMSDASGEALFMDLAVGDYPVGVSKAFEGICKIRHHYPLIKTRFSQTETWEGSATVKDKAETIVEVSLKTYRVVDYITFHRRHIDMGGEDKYGHWWTQVGDAESYGFWPKYPMGHPKNAESDPPEKPAPIADDAAWMEKLQHSASMAVYRAQSAIYSARNSSLASTFAGVEGEMNGQTSFGGTSKKDPHHDDSGADVRIHPVIGDCMTNDELGAKVRSFAQKPYSDTWSWRFEGGKHCHSFQIDMINTLGFELFDFS